MDLRIPKKSFILFLVKTYHKLNKVKLYKFTINRAKGPKIIVRINYRSNEYANDTLQKIKPQITVLSQRREWGDRDVIESGKLNFETFGKWIIPRNKSFSILIREIVSISLFIITYFYTSLLKFSPLTVYFAERVIILNVVIVLCVRYLNQCQYWKL